MSTFFRTDNMTSFMENNKRKLDFTSDDIVFYDYPSPKRKKKKKSKKKRKDPVAKGPNKSKKNLFPGDSVQINNTSNFAVVNAKPENLPSTPQIFNKKSPDNQKKSQTDTSNLFYLNCISNKSFSSDIRNRFINFIKACDPSIDKKTTGGNDLKKKNNKIDPVVQKPRQDRPEVIQKNKAAKEKVDGIFDEDLVIIEEIEVNENSLKCDPNRKNDDRRRREESRKHEENSKSRDHQIRAVPPEKTYQVDIYETCLKDSVVFHMHYPSEFSFHGEIRITVIAGQIEILGCDVNESTIRTVDVYSPNFYVPFIIECKKFKRSYDTEEIKNKIQHLLQSSDIDKLLSNLQSDDAILLVEQIKSKFGSVINLYFHRSLFSKDKVDFSSASKSLKSLQSTFNFRENHEGIRKNPQWDGIPMVDCTVICGGQGVGKSTLLKYFVNKTLMRNKKVLCLDFDPGQPEFTPSGCLSAVIVDKPLLGPNFSHMIDPEIMVFFGSVEVSYNPSLYLECVNYVIKKCRENEEFSQITWFVNTMGFNRGVGVELMIAIIKLLKPNIVVQIRSSDVKKNYPCYFTPRHVNSKDKDWSVLKDNVEVSYDLRVIDSVTQKGKKQLRGGLTSKHLRDVLFFSYFSQMVSPPNYCFNAVKPYIKSFPNLYLGIESFITPREILKAFNGSVVSLAHFIHGSEEIFVPEPETEDYFKIVVKPAISRSYGLGLIRGINVEKKRFYVLTHLSDEKLDEVNCLSLGRIHTPHSTFLIQENIEGQLPYTCVSTIDSIQKVNRFFPQPPCASGNDK